MKPGNTQHLFREPDGALPNTLALGYALGGYALAFVLLTRSGLGSAVLGVLLAAHCMFIAAYLLHEALHQSLLAGRFANRVAGEVLSFVAGGSYASYERLRRLHLRHHHERADVSCFDYKAFLRRCPGPVRALVLALEWLYVPAVEVLMHLQVIVRPLVQPSQRRHLPRVAAMLVLRVGLLALLGVAAPRAVALYSLAYGLLLTALHFFDAFHHTYEQYFIAPDAPLPVPVASRAYEQANTYSNVVVVQPAWLNLLCLNFGYHNAHHERAGVPWYRLPALHRELFSAPPPQLLPLSELIASFHRQRVRRVLSDDYGALGTGRGRADGFVGAHGVSFLSVV
ncbi:MAG: fatty acid desaturase [Deltaproteobacteria bacterium]